MNLDYIYINIIKYRYCVCTHITLHIVYGILGLILTELTLGFL